MRNSTGLILSIMALLTAGSVQAQQAAMEMKPAMAMPDMSKILTAPGVFVRRRAYS